MTQHQKIEKINICHLSEQALSFYWQDLARK
jgi:hypothetical protein